MKKFKRLIMLTAIFVMLFGINVNANDEADTNDKEIGRVFDVDDIMLNVLGGLLGYLLYRMIHNLKDKLPAFLKNNLFYNIIVTIIIGIILFYIFNVLGVVL